MVKLLLNAFGEAKQAKIKRGRDKNKFEKAD